MPSVPTSVSYKNRTNWWPTTTIPYGWQEEGNCNSRDDIDFSFDPWHGRKPTPYQILIRDQFCEQDCPVKDKCLTFGVETKSTGLFGGEFLDEGKILGP